MSRPPFSALNVIVVLALACAIVACGSSEAPATSPSSAPSSAGSDGSTSDEATCTLDASALSRDTPKETTDGTCSDLAPNPPGPPYIVETQPGGEPPEATGGEIATGRYVLTRLSTFHPAPNETVGRVGRAALVVTGTRLFFVGSGDACDAVRVNYGYEATGSKLDVTATCSSHWQSYQGPPPGMPSSWRYSANADELTIIKGSGVPGERTHVEVYAREDAK